MFKRTYSLADIIGMRRDIMIMDNIRASLDGFYMNDRDRILATEMTLRTYLDNNIPVTDLTAERKRWEKKRNDHYGIDHSEDAS